MGTSLYETYLKEQKKPASLYEQFQAEQAKKAPPITHATSDTWSDADNADTSTLGNVSRSVLQGATFGAGNKIVAGGNAVLDAMRGGKFGESYKARLAGERAAEKQFGEQHPIANLGLELAGGVGSMIASGGTSAPATLAKAGRLARIGKSAGTAAVTGFDLGAASGAINADGDLADRATGAMKGGAIGAAGGAILSPVLGAAGYVAGKARIPQAMGYLADKAANVLPARSPMRGAFERFAGSVGPRGEAAGQIGERIQMDEAAGVTPTQHPSNVPTLALDRGGPNLEGLAKGVVRKPGPGAATVRSALAQRDAQMRPEVTQALAQETGVPADAGMQPLREQIAQRSAEARQLYQAAREATAGQPMESPTLSDILKTPAGKSAFTWARAQMGNRGNALPTVETSAPAPAGFSPEQWSGLQEKMRAKGMPVPSGGTEEVPDPETLHFMKQALAKMARLGMNDGTGGTAATQAQGVLNVWGKIREELPDIWRQADDAFAEKSRLIDLMNQGRNIFRTTSNPAGRAERAVHRSLDATQARIANATPEGQQAAQTGAGMGAHALWNRTGRTVKSPGRVFDFDSPERAAQMTSAFPSPDAAGRFEGTVRGWDDLAARSQRITGGSDTAGNLAEEAQRGGVPSALGQLFTGHPVNAMRAFGTGLMNEAASKSRQQLDAEIAKVLSSHDPQALQQAMTSAQFRQRLNDMLYRGAGAGSALMGTHAQR